MTQLLHLADGHLVPDEVYPIRAGLRQLVHPAPVS
jgi:hypothetical protein